MRMTEKLALKVLAAFALVLIPIAVAGYTGYIENQKIVTEHSLHSLTLVAEAKEGQVYGFIENVEGRALDFSSDGLIRDSTEAMLGLDESDPLYTEKQKELSEHLRKHKMPLDENVHQIAVLDLNGRIIAASDRRGIGKDESDYEYFIQGQSRAYASDVHVSSHLSLSEHPYHLTASAPLTSRKTGEVLGVLVNYYDTTGLNKVLSGEFQMEERAMKRIEADEVFDIYIVNSNGLLITPSKFSEGVLEQRIDVSLVQGCAEGREASGAYSNYMGMRVFGASACISPMGWTILVEEPEENALAPLVPLRERAVAVIAMEVALLTILFLIYWRGTISAVIKLSEAAKKVKSGDLTVRAEVKSRDEIGTLSEDFNSMVEALGASQKEIKKARDHLERVINSTKDSILVIDGDYTIIDANPAAFELTGLSKDEIIGKKCYEVNHRKDVPCEDVPCPVKEIFEKGEPINAIHEHFNKDGKLYIVDVTASPIKEEEGSVVGVVEVARDITERKEAEEKIKRLSQFPELNPNPIFQVRKDGKILYYNPGGLNYVDNAKNIKDMLPKDYKELAAKACESWKRIEIDHRYGNVVINYLISPISEETVHIYGSDITERKEAEERLEETYSKLEETYAELRTLDTLKTDIISNVSHELRTPITISKGALELAFEEEDAEGRHKLLKLAIDALRRQDHIVGDLIEAATARVGKKDLNLTRVDIAQLIALKSSEFKSTADKQKIKIDVRTPESLPMVKADAEEIMHVLWNLIDNAIKFNKSKGGVVIEAGKSENMVRVCISDSGIGIPEDQLDKIFEWLYQRDPSSTRTYSGTGMGLAIVKEIVEAHGGEITVKSTPGEGSTFCFTLPISSSAPS
jgi:PAS domain S-box-containing protein